MIEPPFFPSLFFSPAKKAKCLLRSLQIKISTSNFLNYSHFFSAPKIVWNFAFSFHFAKIKIKKSPANCEKKVRDKNLCNVTVRDLVPCVNMNREIQSYFNVSYIVFTYAYDREFSEWTHCFNRFHWWSSSKRLLWCLQIHIPHTDNFLWIRQDETLKAFNRKIKIGDHSSEKSMAKSTGL